MHPRWATSVKASGPPMKLTGTIEAGLRQLRRKVPMEMTLVTLPGGDEVTVPTMAEALRVKAFLVVQRNQSHRHRSRAARTTGHGWRGRAPRANRPACAFVGSRRHDRPNWHTHAVGWSDLSLLSAIVPAGSDMSAIHHSAIVQGLPG